MFIDQKYILLISYKLRNFKQKNDNLFNFSCPFCGDSRKLKNRARGFFYKRGNGYFYKCHNCQESKTFSNFLKEFDNEEYRKYIVEKSEFFGERKVISTPKPNIEEDFAKDKKLNIKTIGLIISSIDSLPEQHYAVQYIKNRKIPKKFWNEFFYTEDYKAFINKIIPDCDKELYNEPRIVMFYTDIDGNITSVAGRSLKAADKKMRYITIKVEEGRKIFGLHRLNLSEKVYIVEGQIDSLFIDNCIASGDSNLSGVAEYLNEKFSISNITLVYDCEPRNRELVKQIGTAIKKGFAVTLLPYNENSKDINDLILSGEDESSLRYLIDKYTFSGLTADMKFLEWRKI